MRPLSIRRATASDIADIEAMVADFVKGHPAENHRRATSALREAFFGAHQVFATLDGFPVREIVRGLPAKGLGLETPA